LTSHASPPPEWLHAAGLAKVRALKTKSYLAQMAIGVALLYWVGEAAASLAQIVGIASSVPGPIWDTLATAELLYPLLFVGCGTLFIVWSYGAHSNLKRFGRSELRHVDRATIWWWFVPFAFLYVPHRVIHETARGSLAAPDDLHWKDKESPAFAKWWTGLFLTSFTVSQVAAAIMAAAPNTIQLDVGMQVLLAGSILMIAAAATAIVLISRITDAQVGLANRLWAGGDGPMQVVVPTGHGSLEPYVPSS
jgi:hypothetical protein